MFGCLGLLGFGAWFIRKRRDETVTDERDHEIQRLATTAGINVAWIGLFMAIIVMVVTNPDSDVVSKAPLQWVLWIHFAICYLVKGFVGVAQYRKGQRAS